MTIGKLISTAAKTGEKIVTIKKKGLVTEVFDNESLSKLKGFSAVKERL